MSVRSQRIVVVEAPNPPERFERGVCMWCGEPIELVDPEYDYRRRSRTRHHGDGYEKGDRNCNREHYRSYVFTARDALEISIDGELVCVDCDTVCAGPRREGMSRQGFVAWEADHEVPLWLGGAHELANFRVRCEDCHRTKTRHEAAARAAYYRGHPPVHVPDWDQLTLS